MSLVVTAAPQYSRYVSPMFAFVRRVKAAHKYLVNGAVLLLGLDQVGYQIMLCGGIDPLTLVGDIAPPVPPWPGFSCVPRGPFGPWSLSTRDQPDLE